jgi:hypothetical protein
MALLQLQNRLNSYAPSFHIGTIMTCPCGLVLKVHVSQLQTEERGPTGLGCLLGVADSDP